VGSFEPSSSGPPRISSPTTNTHPLLGTDRQAAANPNYLNQPALQNTTGLQGYLQTPMTYSSVTFNSNGSIADTSLEEHVRPNNVIHDSQKANINIATRNSGGLHTFNSHSGISEIAPSTTSVQLRVPDGKVQIGAYRTDAATAETLKVQAPEMFEDPAIKAAADAAAAADEAAAAEEAAAMNTHPDAYIEESHTKFTDVVPAQLQTELLVQMHRDGVPSKDTLNRVADALGVTVDDAVTRLNAMSAGVQAQLSVLAKARGVNPEQFANWARDNRRGESLRAMQGHVQSRNLLSWDGLINEFKASGQR
jgi:hypothetical protein